MSIKSDNPHKSNNAAASRLRDEKSQVIRRWQERVKCALPLNARRDEFALLSKLPAFLDQLIKMLDGATIAPTAVEPMENEEKIDLPPYSLPQVLLEYRLLREIIFDVLEAEGMLPKNKRDIVFEQIQKGMTEASSEFAHIRLLREQIALHHAEAALKELQDLQAFTDAALAKCTNLNDLFADLLGRIRAVFEADVVCVLLLNHDNSCLEIRAAHGLGVDASFPIQVALENTLAGDVLKKGTAVITENESDIAKLGPRAYPREARVMICVPIKAEKGVIGTLHIGFVRAKSIKSHETTIYQLTAARLGRAVENATLHEGLKRDYALLQSQQALQSQLISSMAHNIRTPLTSAYMTAQLMGRRLAKPELTETFALRIVHAIRRADSRVQDLLALNRVFGNRHLNLHIEELSFSKVVQGAVERLIQYHGEHFLVDDDGSAGKGFWARLELERVVELFGDGIIARSNSSGPMVFTIRKDLNDNVVLTVIDHEGTLGEEALKNLSLPVKRQELDMHAASDRAMGLTIARALVEAHGGKVQARYNDGKEIQFMVTIPRDCRKHRLTSV